MTTLPPFVTLVDLDGFPVGPGEKDIPDVPPPDPTDPADWPAWTDDWYWEPTDPEPPDSWEGSAAAGWAQMLIESSLPPIRGGAPDDGPGFVPSEADWADYRNHFDRGELLYGYE